jgi:hypothetical protein
VDKNYNHNKRNKKYAIVFLPRVRWDSGDYRRSEALADEMSKKSNIELVLYINHPQFFLFCLYRVFRNFINKLFKKEFRSNNSLIVKCSFIYQVCSKLFIANPIYFVPKRFQTKRREKRGKYFFNLNYYLIALWLKNKTKFPNIIFVDPFRNNVLTELPHFKYTILAADVYDDPFDQPLARALFKSQKQLERRKTEFIDVLQKADIIFANSQHLINKYFGDKQCKVHLIPSGIKINNSINYKDSKALPCDLVSIKRPRVGYVGNLNYSIDIDLLIYVLENNKFVNFILIGKPKGNKKGILKELTKKYNNLILLGHKPHKVIKQYINNMDVLFSFKRTEMTKGNDSLKIYEYLLSGKPIVTTPVSPAKKFKDSLYIGEDVAEFDRYLKIALKEDNIFLNEKRKKLAMMNSWENRVNKMLEKLYELKINNK